MSAVVPTVASSCCLGLRGTSISTREWLFLRSVVTATGCWVVRACLSMVMACGEREGGREGGRKGGREGGREGGSEGEREGGREGKQPCITMKHL